MWLFIYIFCLFLTKWEYFVKFGKKEQNILANSQCLCGHPCIRDIMLKECKSVKEFKLSFLRKGQKKSYLWDIHIDYRYDVLFSITLIGDSQNQSYLNLSTLIKFKLKVRYYISSVYFSWKYGLRMGQHGFRKMYFQTLKTWIKKIIRILSILSCHSSSPHSQQKNNCI